MSKQRIFIDTNVWFSYFYGSKNAEIIIDSFVNDEIIAVISKNVLDELVKNIVQKMPKLEKIMFNFFDTCPPEVVDSPSEIDKDVKKYVDFKDRHIFQVCIDAGCKIFITGNLKDFDVNSIYKKYKIRVLSPKEAVIGLGLDTQPK